MVVFPQSVYYHLPKAAGTFVRQVAIDLNLLSEPSRIFTRYGADHATPGEAPWRCRESFQFTFVRHPVQWYRSIFSHRRKQVRSIDHEDYIYWWGAEGSKVLHSAFNDCGNHFDRFVASVTRTKPGWLGDIVARYTDGVDFIGRAERASESLVQALKLAGESFDAQAILSHKWVNTSQKFPVSCASRDRILESEPFALQVWENCQ